MTFQVLLLDEVTVDLDVVTRMDLLDFFREECEQVFTGSVYFPPETHWILSVESCNEDGLMQHYMIAGPDWK